MNSALVSWEAEYFDGSVVREAQGAVYKSLDRDRISAFRLVVPGEILVELRVKPGQNGHQIAYRRRTLFSSGERQVWYCLGMIPNGPVLAYQPETDQVLKSEKFHSGAGPLGKMIPLPFERWTNTAHSLDAMVRRSSVVLPSGAVLNV